MDFEVCFLPSEATRRPPPVAVLIDVIRASSTIVTLLDRGAAELALVRQEDLPKLDGIRARVGAALVCAEDPSGVKAAIADLSPSPAALRNLDLRGQRVIFCTTNGTLAATLLRQAGVEHVLVGCMRNGAAVMAEAVALARRLDRSVSLVCAGRNGCRIPAIDDVYCAAALMRHGEAVAQAAGIGVTLLESAMIARHASSVFAGTREAFDQSMSAAVVRRVGAPDDVAYCGDENVTRCVPVVTFEDGATLVHKTGSAGGTP